ncbi:MAG: phosphatase PAP2 family protein [Deltaproteobacteria bacterium]|nr:phosphatase PAP2 family protein [Deltaproteobacteria bacterium]
MESGRSKKRFYERIYDLFDKTTFYLGPDLIFLFILIAVLVILSLVYGNRKFTPVKKSVVVPLVVFCGLLFFGILARVRLILSGQKEKVKELITLTLNMARDWFPLLLIILIYENLHDLTDLIHPETLDKELAELDLLIFGVQPTIWLQRFVHPLLNDYMTFAYGLYFFYPATILGLIYSKGDLFKFREVALSFVICVVVGFIGYVTVPAVGPRYFLADEYTIPLTGYITEAGARAWNSIESVKRDCFPSLHTAMSTITLVYFYRFKNFYKGGKIIFYLALPLVVSLWISTVYLRYHWVVDVFAGWILAIICVNVAPMFIRWYYYRKTGKRPEVSTDIK